MGVLQECPILLCFRDTLAAECSAGHITHGKCQAHSKKNIAIDPQRESYGCITGWKISLPYGLHMPGRSACLHANQLWRLCIRTH